MSLPKKWRERVSRDDEYAFSATLVSLNLAPPIIMTNFIFGTFWSAIPCKKIEYSQKQPLLIMIKCFQTNTYLSLQSWQTPRQNCSLQKVHTHTHTDNLGAENRNGTISIVDYYLRKPNKTIKGTKLDHTILKELQTFLEIRILREFLNSILKLQR